MQNNNIKKMVQLSLFTTIALTIFVAESYLPVLVPIVGVKLGLANIVTLIVLMLWGWKEAFLVLVLRVILGSMFTGTMVSLLYSLGGGILCLVFMTIAKMICKKKMVWLISIIGAITHNIGQLLVAWLILGNKAVFFYFPVLLASGIITGIFTGVGTQVLILKNVHIQRLFQDT